jgi:hypothetical protein
MPKESTLAGSIDLNGHSISIQSEVDSHHLSGVRH